MSRKRALNFKTLELIVEDTSVARFAVVAGSLCGIPDRAGWRHILGIKEPGGMFDPVILRIDAVAAALTVRHCTLQHILRAQDKELAEPVEFRVQACALKDERRPRARMGQARLDQDIVLRLSP